MCYMTENVKLYQGDCLKVMDRLIVEGVKVDLTVTSPPYDNLRSYNGNNDLWNEDVWRQVIEKLYKITSDGGAVVWVVGDATVNGSETGTSFKQALYFKECGFNLHDTMIWNKNGFSAVGALKTRYAPVFEYMFVFTKGKLKIFNPIKDKPNKWAGTRNHGTVRVDGDIRRPVSNNKVINKYGQRYNIWDITPHRQKGDNKHPAPFPEKLANDHIISWSNENDIVFDPFMGSGTTGKMALLNNRKFIGVEIDESYFKIAHERINLK